MNGPHDWEGVSAYDQHIGAYRFEYDWAGSVPVGTAVVEAVAEVLETDPDGLEPLYRRLDPDALDGLFRRRAGRPTDGAVRFRFNGRRVTFLGGGTILVWRPGDPGRAGAPR